MEISAAVEMDLEQVSPSDEEEERGRRLGAAAGDADAAPQADPCQDAHCTAQPGSRCLGMRGRLLETEK